MNIKRYLEALELLLEIIGMHPRRTHNEELCETLRRWGWRPFHCERLSR